MKLYLLTRDDYVDYDEYLGAVIATTSSQKAMQIMNGLACRDWKCTLIAKTVESKIEEGIILDSYQSG